MKMFWGLLVVFFSLQVALLAGEIQGEAAAPVGTESARPQPPAREFIPGQVVVQVRPGVGDPEVRALAAQLQARVAGRIPEYRLYLLELPEAAAAPARVQEAIDFLQKQPQVESAFPNYKAGIPEPLPPISPTKPGGGTP